MGLNFGRGELIKMSQEQWDMLPTYIIRRQIQTIEVWSWGHGQRTVNDIQIFLELDAPYYMLLQEQLTRRGKR